MDEVPAPVEIDTFVCIGAGQCELLAPDVFQVSDEGTASIVGAVSEAVAEATVAACPSGAIRRTGPSS